jgi:hypothetical protein
MAIYELPPTFPNDALTKCRCVSKQRMPSESCKDLQTSKFMQNCRDIAIDVPFIVRTLL